MRDQAQDLKEETIEMKEAVEMRDQAQDLKEETIEMKEAEKENLLVLKKNLTERRSLLKRVLEIREKNFQEKNKNLEINFDR